MRTKYRILPIFISFQGCPHQCIYCNQNEITGSWQMTPDLAEKEIKEALGMMEDFQVAFYGGTFTSLPKDLQLAYFHKLSPYLGKEIRGVRISTRPDAIESDHLEALKKLGLETVELGAQSMDQMVLNASLRGHSVEDVREASEKVRRANLELGIQQMLGLPGEDEDSFKTSVSEICRIKPDFVRLYPTLVLKDTPLAKLYQQGNYQPLDLEKAIQRGSFAYGCYLEEGIEVIRMGLQATENISYEKDLLAGPFHPSFGQMVKCHYLVDRLIKTLRTLQVNEVLEITGPARMLANLIGQKAYGRKKLEDYFGPIKFLPTEDPNLLIKTSDRWINLGDDKHVFKIN